MPKKLTQRRGDAKHVNAAPAAVRFADEAWHRVEIEGRGGGSTFGVIDDRAPSEDDKWRSGCASDLDEAGVELREFGTRMVFNASARI